MAIICSYLSAQKVSRDIAFSIIDLVHVGHDERMHRRFAPLSYISICAMLYVEIMEVVGKGNMKYSLLCISWKTTFHYI